MIGLARPHSKERECTTRRGTAQKRTKTWNYLFPTNSKQMQPENHKNLKLWQSEITKCHTNEFLNKIWRFFPNEKHVSLDYPTGNKTLHIHKSSPSTSLENADWRLSTLTRPTLQAQLEELTFFEFLSTLYPMWRVTLTGLLYLVYTKIHAIKNKISQIYSIFYDWILMRFDLHITSRFINNLDFLIFNIHCQVNYLRIFLE